MRSVLKKTIAGLLFPMAATALQGAVTSTHTTLTISPSSTVVAGTVVTLTAAVQDGATVVRKGTVLFCNAALASCSPHNGLYGAAQLTSSGTASLRTSFGVGVNNIKAMFVPTITHAGSTSLTVALGVTASSIYASSTTLTSTGTPDNYDLIGTVTGFGSQTLTGTIRLLDLTYDGIELGVTSLSRPTWTFASVMNTPKAFSLSGLPVSVAVGDFNGDGKLDVATANDDDNGLIAVLCGNGDGSFQSPTTYPVGVDPVFVTVGDFNGDGRLDLAIASSNSNNVSVMLGNGDGTFQTPVATPTGAAPESIAVGDFNADGQLDLAVANFNGNNVSILLGNGDGTFQAQTVYGAGSSPASIKVDDFNGDGNLDLVVSNRSSNTVSVLVGRGDGTFHPPASYATGTSPVQVSVGDFNRDGKVDLVAVNVDSSDVSVLLGNGDGTFRTQASYATGTLPVSIVVVDFDGDGNLDVATASAANGGTVSVLLGAGDGSFQPALKYASSSGSDGPDSMAVGDFDGDGQIDLASAFGSDIRILLGEQVATFGANGISVPGTGLQNVVALYSGDGSCSGSTSNTITLNGLEASTITLTSSQPSLTVGQTALLTARVGSGATGIVSFIAGSVALGSVTIDGSGTAVLSTQLAGLPPGSYVVTASYSGNSNFAASSASLTEVLLLANTTVSLASSSDPSSYGSLVTFTVTLTPGTTGTVALTDGATVIGTTAVNGGGATFSINSLSAGSHAMTAVYSGDHNFAGATSPAVVQFVNKVATNMTLTSTANPSSFGSNVVFVAVVAPGATGTVTFSDETVVFGIVSLDQSGRAALSTAALSSGTHNITATYSGDANHF